MERIGGMRFYRPIHFVMSGCRLLNDKGGALSQDELIKLWGLYKYDGGFYFNNIHFARGI